MFSSEAGNLKYIDAHIDIDIDIDIDINIYKGNSRREKRKIIYISWLLQLRSVDNGSRQLSTLLSRQFLKLSCHHLVHIDPVSGNLLIKQLILF